MADNLESSLQDTNDSHLLSAEYKDGQLQIVEVTPFDKSERVAGSDMPELEADSETKYVQVINSDKSMMQLDLLNLTLVRCEDGVESYRLVSNVEAGDSSSEGTVTCVLQSSDNEETEGRDSYVVVEGTEGPLVFLKSALSTEQETPPPAKEAEPKKTRKLSPVEILERAKSLQNEKRLLLSSHTAQNNRRGPKRKSELPPPHELLSSPNFKLFLYSCKSCSFKCNAVKEMTAHKASEHSGNSSGGKWKRIPTLQCGLCAYRGYAHSQLMKHIQEMHGTQRSDNKVVLDSSDVESADVLVCGACGFESSSRPLFRAHIASAHGAIAC